MADIARLDFNKAPPDYRTTERVLAHGPNPAALKAAWAHYKAENDPPGITTVPDESRPPMDFRRTRFRCEWTVYLVAAGVEHAVTFNERDQRCARAAAWRWYEARLELYNILRKLNPPREYWPLILTWSDQDVIDVHAFLVTNFDVILTGGADGLAFPGVLLG